jgi:hypothetical protein
MLKLDSMAQNFPPVPVLDYFNSTVLAKRTSLRNMYLQGEGYKVGIVRRLAAAC